MKLRSVLGVFFKKGPFSFCLRALFLLLVLSFISINRPFTTWVEAPVIRLDAWLTHRFLLALGITTEVDGTFVRSPELSVEVIPECTGIFVVVILVALTLAYPARWASRLRSIFLGFVWIFCLNQLRLVTLFLVRRSYPEIFEDMHLYVWQSIFILAVVLYWYGWARRALVGAGAPGVQPQVLL